MSHCHPARKGNAAASRVTPLWNQNGDSDPECIQFKANVAAEWAKDAYISCSDIPSRLSLLLLSGVLTDVVFLFGDDEKEVRAHRFILMERSEYFHTMFSDRWNASRKAVRIPGVESADFESFLHFIYTGTTEVKAENALTLLYLARNYEYPAMKVKAVQFIMNNMNEDLAFPVLKSLSLYEDPDAIRLTAFASLFICKNASTMFMRPEFVELRYKDLDEIMDEKICHENELQIFNSCLRWAVEQCNMKKLEQLSESYRNVLRGILKKIRFPLIGSILFLEEVPNLKDLLNREEKEALLSYWGTELQTRLTSLSGSGMQIQNIFNVKPRGKATFTVNRFRSFETTTKSWCYPSARRGKKADRISFQVSTAGMVNGIGLYGPADNVTSGSVDYELDVQIYAHNRMETVYLSEKYKQTASQSSYGPDSLGRIFNIMFKHPVQIIPNVWYTISVVFASGSKRSYYGISGNENTVVSCQMYPVEFKFQAAIDRSPNEFSSSRLSSNATCISRGQIPTIHFSIDDEDDLEEVIVRG